RASRVAGCVRCLRSLAAERRRTARRRRDFPRQEAHELNPLARVDLVAQLGTKKGHAAKSQKPPSPPPFPGNGTAHWRAASAAGSGTVVQTAADSPLQSPPSLLATWPHSAGSGYSKTQFRGARLPATTWSANKSTPLLPGPEICPPSRSSYPAAAPTNQLPARCTAQQSECLPLSAAVACPHSKTTSLPVATIPSQCAPPVRLHRPRSSCSPHAPPAQTTTPHPRATDGLRARGCASMPRIAIAPHKKAPM